MVRVIQLIGGELAATTEVRVRYSGSAPKI